MSTDPVPAATPSLRIALVRVVAVAAAILGVNYIVWRWTSSINWTNWWIAVPLALAETYSFVDSCLFAMTAWRLRERGVAPPTPPGLTVDVFITTYDEDVELVMATAAAAKSISHRHTTWILDDGARPEMEAAADALGVGYIRRTDDWAGRPRHAKAGNLNNALMQTSGEFLLILDADQVPHPDILDRTLGWFADERVALVQTPQWFHNVPDHDPLGSQAPLFYGPIQQGKDGWNAAFFCGSNAILRREALMRIGVDGYVSAVRSNLDHALATARRVLTRAHRNALRHGEARVAAALDEVSSAACVAQQDLSNGEPYGEIVYRFQRAVNDAAGRVVADDLATLRADLLELAEMSAGITGLDAVADVPVIDDEALERLSSRDWSPLGAIRTVQTLLTSIDVDRDDEALPVMPMATISVTEDMATAMRIHRHGWRSVYHHEILAEGLAPEDLGSMLHQRLRWAQGTLQVMLRENPLTQRGLRPGQRLMYFATMWSYLSGFAALCYIAAPVLYLTFGVKPVQSFGSDFLWHLLPYLLVNQLVFWLVGRGSSTWRGQQYSLALFPVWIRACVTAAGNVWFGRDLGFVVTPKGRQQHRARWDLVRVQLATMVLLVAAVAIGLTRLAVGVAPTAYGTYVNVIWAVYDLVVLSVVVDAVLYEGSPGTGRTEPPDRERDRTPDLEMVN